jgi:pilus assembly protein FimV
LIAMRAFVTALLAAVLISPLPASALELGPSRLLSAAGEPLNVEIPVLQAEPEQLERLRPQLPARSRSANLAGATITLEREGPGSPLLRVRSVGPIDAKAVTFLVIADWGRGRTLRTYTVLPESPVQSPSTLSTSAGGAGSAAATPEVIRSTPIEEGSPVPRARVEAETVIPAGNAAPTPTAGTDTNAVTRAVRRNETLMSISREWSARTGATLAQTMLGIYRANPEAFGNGMGDMKVGSTLKLPDAATLRAVSNAEANREVGRQLGIWGQSAPSVSAPAASEPAKPTVPKPATSPSVPAAKPAPAPVAPAAKPAPAPAAKPAPALTLAPAKPAAPAAPAIAPAVAPVVVPPVAVAKDPAFKSLEARVAQAERELAALQARLGQVEKVKVAPPPVVAPTPAPAVGGASPPSPVSTTPAVAAPATPPPAPLTFNEPTPSAKPAEGAAPVTPPADPPVAGPKVPALPAAPPFTPAPSLQQRALDLANQYWWALAGVGGALVLGIAALVIVRRRRAAAAAASAEPAQEMTFDLPPIKPSRAEPEDLEDVLMRPGTGGAAGTAAASPNGAAAGAAAAAMGAATMAAAEPSFATPETRVTPPPLPDDLEGDPPPIDEAGSMIDLARAYIEMGNFDSAMMELQTALRTGDEAQRAEALRLLDSLPKS